MKALIFISLVLTSTVLQGQNVHNEVFIIPKGYTGFIYVLFNQKNSPSNTFKNSKRIYNIPKDGILLTKSPPYFNYTNQTFYYIDSSGKLTKIPKQNSETSILPSTNVVTFYGSTDLYSDSSTSIYYLKIVISNNRNDQQINSPQYKFDFEKKVSLKIGTPFNTFPTL